MIQYFTTGEAEIDPSACSEGVTYNGLVDNTSKLSRDIDVSYTKAVSFSIDEELSDNKRKVVLCHYPIMCYNGQYRVDEVGNPKTYMLYGHVHDTQDQRLLEQFQEITRNTKTVNARGEEQSIPCNMINCFCMYSDYEPLTLDEWIELYQIKGTGEYKQ